MASDTVKRQILEAAGPVFAERGFKAATVREICSAAEVNVASINYYFGDKQQLYVESVKMAHELKSHQVPMPEWSDGMSSKEKLHQFIHLLLRRMLGEQQAQWQTRLMMREVLKPTEACRSLVEDYFRPQFERLLSILDDFLPDAPPASQHQLAFSIIGQCFFYLAAGETVPLMISKKEIKQHYCIDDLADHIAGFTHAALVSQDREWLTASKGQKQKPR